MKPETMVLILIVAVAVIIAVLGVWSVIRRKRSQNLRQKFGTEYDFTLNKAGDRRTAEAALDERAERMTQLDIRNLNENERNRYHGEWTEIQALFVDNPAKSVKEANRLITEVMIARGFPVADFEQRAADISVMYPDFVSNYRNANAIALKNQNNAASTEELRQALVYYHSLYNELVGTAESREVEYEEKVVKAN